MKIKTLIIQAFNKILPNHNPFELKRRLDKQERILKHMFKDYEQYSWLLENDRERMDASTPFYNESRAEFHRDRYKFAAKYIAGKTILDVASGTGYGSEILLREGKAASVTGMEIDCDAASYANHFHSVDGKIKFICGSGLETGFDDQSLDTVVSFETIEHVKDDEALLKEFHRILKTDGELIISTPSNWPKDDNPFHFNAYNRNVLQEKLEKFFAVKHMYNFNSNTPGCNKGVSGVTESTEENMDKAEALLAICQKKN